MDWSQIRTWPNSQLSRQGHGPVHRWHIQETGTGKTVLMLHGAGGSTHSYRHMIHDLGQDMHVVALDLPGHGFTQLGARHRSGLDPTAEEEGLAEAVVTVVVDPESGDVCHFRKAGGAAVSRETVQECTAMAKKQAKTIKKMMDRAAPLLKGL